MSGRVVSAVFGSDLPAWLKPYAGALATFAADDGSRVYPSVATLARLVGRSERSAQRALRELRARGVIKREHGPGHRRAPQYQFRAIALPQIGDENQLALFPQARVQKHGLKSPEPEVFHSHAQVLTGHQCPVMGDTSVTRSVIDPSLRTSTRRDARKTGTR